ncbi:MAG: SRPBCC domain-containing protein, partial [Fidelibacterota bacterium]
ITSFFAPAASIDLRIDGKYEILFNPGAEPGFRGAEGVRLLAIQTNKMLSFTWNAPPHLPDVRKQWTHVVIRFEEISAEKTKVTLHHDGWGTGGQWDDAFDYFTNAWLKIVFPRLKYRFDNGPVDWDNR